MKYSKIATTFVYCSLAFGASTASADLLDVHMSIPKDLTFLADSAKLMDKSLRNISGGDIGLNLFGSGETIPASGDDGFDPDKVTVHYEGGIISPEYAAETLNRSDMNEQNYPHHMLFPHGKGTLVYRLDGAVIEHYEGEFKEGQYHGQGTLIDRHGEFYEGEFQENLYKG
jgi:hypothetical protein